MNHIGYFITILSFICIACMTSCEYKENPKSNIEMNMPYHSAVICIKGYSYFYGFSEHEKKLEQIFIIDDNGKSHPLQCNINKNW